MNYEIRNPEVEAQLKELGRYLKEQMPPGMAFTLLMSDIGRKGAMFYISSVVREDAIASMLEFVAKQGGRADMWLVWSNEHKAWWRQNGNGYTQNRLEAGIYSFGEAAQICRDANEHPQVVGLPNETMVQL
jgi:hypothetical protein